MTVNGVRTGDKADQPIPVIPSDARNLLFAGARRGEGGSCILHCKHA